MFPVMLDSCSSLLFLGYVMYPFGASISLSVNGGIVISKSQGYSESRVQQKPLSPVSVGVLSSLLSPKAFLFDPHFPFSPTITCQFILLSGLNLCIHVRVIYS